MKRLLDNRTDQRHPLYRTWVQMRQRCLNQRDRKYPYYGGRGITVCASWKRFNAFLSDMGPRPSPAHTLDRKDNNGNYEPGNCRWATQIEQQNNRRDNFMITVNGETKTCARWAREVNIKPTLVRQRIVRDGLDPANALSKPRSRW